MKIAGALVTAFLGLCLGWAYPAHAATVDLANLLENSGFEDDLKHSDWMASRANPNFTLDAPKVNPVIVPKDESTRLAAPAGNNFIGILNPNDLNRSGKLVHSVVEGSFPAGTVFQVTVWANRGRLAKATSALFTSSPSEVLVQLNGWEAGHLPVLNPKTDNWSRSPNVKVVQVFTDWAENGEWASQTFEFVTTKDLQYVSLAITGVNHKNASYVAFDVE